MDSTCIEEPQVRSVSVLEFLQGWIWSIGGGLYIGALSGAIYGTFLFPIAGTVVGALAGGAVGFAGALIIGPAISAAAFIGETPADRQRLATKVGAAGNLVLCAAAALLLFLYDGAPVLVAAVLMPTTLGAAWTGGYVARSNFDSQTSIQLSKTGITIAHVVIASVVSPALVWAVGFLMATVK